MGVSIVRSCGRALLELRGDDAVSERRCLPGRSATSGGTWLAARPSLAMPLRRTPRAVNDRCCRKATPSEGSTYRSEPVERSRMCPREGARSPRAYQEAQGHRRTSPRLATHSGSEDRTNIEANDLARHPQFLSPDTLT